MFFVGDDYYGKVERLPGYFHVATRFLHVWWLPLVPRESYLILEDAEAKRGFQIPLCWKSVIKAYVFGYAIMFAILGFTVPLILYFEKGGFHQPHELNAMIVLGTQATLALAIACWFARTPLPKVDRAMELGAMAGFEPEVISEAMKATHR